MNYVVGYAVPLQGLYSVDSPVAFNKVNCLTGYPVTFHVNPCMDYAVPSKQMTDITASVWMINNVAQVWVIESLAQVRVINNVA